MKVCCIGDIHGTDKFLTCYNDILKNDNDCEKIIVFGDHFDPYQYFSLEEMIEKYNKFSEILKEDSRIVSLLGNHDLSYYIISNDLTNRTHKWRGASKITDCIVSNLDKSYLCYRINDYLFSHAGVSKYWIDEIKQYVSNPNYVDRILNNYQGWTEEEMFITSFYPFDESHYGDDVHQGCTWIRPTSLITCALDDYNQVVAHTGVKEISKVQMDNGKDLWMIDTCGKPDYLTLNI